MSGEEDGVSTTTGATPDQIEAAVARRYNETSATARLFPWSDVHRDMQRTMKDLFVRDCATYLVPPDMVIASAADVAKVPTAEEIAAIRDMRSSLLHNVPAFDGSPLHVTISAYLERVKG